MSELSRLSGIGKKREQILIDAGIKSLRALVYYLPRRYVDRTKISQIRQVRKDEDANLCVNVTDSSMLGGGRKTRLVVNVSDGSGTMELVFFNGAKFWEKRFSTGQRLQVCGMVTVFRYPQIVHPDVTFLKDGEDPKGSILPVYPLTEAMTNSRVEHKFIQRIALEALEKYSFSDPLPSGTRDAFGLGSEPEILKRLHAPESMAAIPSGMRQIKIRELIPVCIRMEESKRERAKKGRSLIGTGELADMIKSSLSFELTKGQKESINNIIKALERPEQVHGLLEGDVGSGKTLTALLACTPALESNNQIAVMVPTEILAQQQFKSISSLVKNTGIRTALLLGSTSATDRKEILDDLKNGEIHILIGTHVLYSADVVYHKLGFVIIDEQHRYGVHQREALISKGHDPDVLYMTATPIPRTLTHTLYGDLENFVLRDMPPGRKPINTRLVPGNKRNDMYDFLVKQVETGEQIYWVVPRIIDKSDEGIEGVEPKIELQSLEALHKELKSYSSNWKIDVVHGQLAADQKESILLNFKDGKTNILIATTVIEVGIDVPNANMMIIENPDRFGMAQLHQLRGRVGRGEKQAWCFLAMPTEGYPDKTMEKLTKFRENNDGFKIAELDLEFRGSGDIEGISQSGFGALQHTDLIRDFSLVMEVRQKCSELMR